MWVFPTTVCNATLYVQLDASDLQIYSLILIEKGAIYYDMQRSGLKLIVCGPDLHIMHRSGYKM